MCIRLYRRLHQNWRFLNRITLRDFEHHLRNLDSYMLSCIHLHHLHYWHHRHKPKLNHRLSVSHHPHKYFQCNHPCSHQQPRSCHHRRPLGQFRHTRPHRQHSCSWGSPHSDWWDRLRIVLFQSLGPK